MNPYDAAHTLAKAIRESNELKELKAAREALKADETAKNMLKDFRKEQIDLQHKKMTGLEIPKESEEKLARLFEVVNMNNLVKRYMDAEYRIAIMMDDVQKIISEATAEIIDSDLMKLAEDENGADSE